MQDSQESAVATPSERTRPAAASEIAGAAAVGRRRLIKAGAAAVPVAATLVSRPAFAWHGKTPSAWGSEQLNPNTSLKAVHEAYADEVWSISDWANNTSRTSFGNTWDVLVQKFPAVKTSYNSTFTRTGKVCDYRKVTFKELCNAVPSLKAPAGVSGDLLVASNIGAYGSSFQVAVVVAQLNYILLSGKIPDLKKIVSLEALQQMAQGTFKPNISSQKDCWSQATTLLYLQQNWLAV